jgi:hypothetical protein
MKSHSYHLPDLELEKETGHQEEIRGVEEEEGVGIKDGSRRGCRMEVMVLVVAIQAEEAIRAEEAIKVEEGHMVVVEMIRTESAGMGTEESDLDHLARVKVKARVKDGSPVEGMMDLLHLDDLDLEVQDEGKGRDHHHQGVDHLHQPPGAEMTPHHQGDETTFVLDVHHHHEDVGMTTIPRPERFVTTHHPQGRDEILPHLEVKQMAIHHPDAVGTIHHLVELEVETNRDPDPGRDQLPSLLLEDVVGARAEVGVERGHHHPMSGDEGVRPRLHPERMLLKTRWIRAMGMVGRLRSQKWSERDEGSKRKRRPKS